MRVLRVFRCARLPGHSNLCRGSSVDESDALDHAKPYGASEGGRKTRFRRSNMKWFCGSFMALSVLVCLAPVCQADDRAYQDLLRRLPDSTNVVVVADVPAL